MMASLGEDQFGVLTKPTPFGRKSHFQHSQSSELKENLRIDDQAVDQTADRCHRSRIDYPDDRNIGLVDGDGWAGGPSAR